MTQNYVEGSDTLKIVLLGDACSGKSSLMRALLGEPFKSDYEPTLGTDMRPGTFTSAQGTVNTMIFDCSGSERLLCPAQAPPLIHADLCILVVDSTAPQTLSNLDSWHDEYLQTGFGGAAPPAFIVVITKIDAEDRRAVQFEDVVGWSGKEPHDPALWPDEATSRLLPAPPVIETCARDNRGVPNLTATIADRLLTRQRVAQCLAAPVCRFERFEQSSAMRLAVFGDAERAKDALVAVGTHAANATELLSSYLPVETVERDQSTHATVDAGAAVLDVWLAPTSAVGAPLTFCRGAHVCVFALKLSIHPMLHRIHYWREIFMRESGLRDANSVLWVVAGWRMSDYIAEASAEAASFCIKHGFVFLELPETPTIEYVARSWSLVADAACKKRNELVYARTTAHSTTFDEFYAPLLAAKSRRNTSTAADGRDQTGNGDDDGSSAPLTEERLAVLGARRPSSLVATQRLDLIESKCDAMHRLVLGHETDMARHVRELQAATEGRIAALETQLRAAHNRIAQQDEVIGDLRIEMRALWQELESSRVKSNA